ncbi:MAG TPA: MMPL family transporter [Gaiellaceae bacterium]|nr:MMPL family transporter [Gaiellaceae bacterium]
MTTEETKLAEGGRLARLADLAYRRRGLIVVAWVAVLVGVVAGVSRFAADFDVDFGTPGSESDAALDVLEEHFPRTSGESVNVVWTSEAGAGSPAVERRVGRFLAEAARLDDVGRPGPTRISPDGTVGLATLGLEEPAWDVPTATGERLIELAEDAGGNGLRLEVGGNLIRNAQGGTSPEAAGLLAAAVILLVAFGSVVAAGLPLLIAVFGLGISATLIGVLAGFVDVPEFTPAVAGLIGIGVGIDYALLVVTRFRTALAGGSDPRAAVAEAVSTAGRSVLVAGGTVVISLLGLFLMGIGYLQGVALGASLAVLVVMAASVTLLPAVLAFAGRRVDRLRLPGLGRTLRSDEGTFSSRWSRSVQRRAWPAAVLASVALVALAVPVLGLRFGFPDEGTDPAGAPTREAYELASEGFGPGSAGPLLLVAELSGSDAEGALERLAAGTRAAPGVAYVGAPVRSPDGAAALLTVVPAGSPQSGETEELVRSLRDEVVPAASAGSGADVHVGGLTAAFIDQTDYVSGRLPLFFAGVVGLSFLLLLVAFRSPLLALKAGVMNLLSIGAAYGVTALVAEGGAVGSLVGVEGDTPVPPFMPVMMFAILFGLSMDYEVFLLSRVREEYLRHGDTSRAVRDGLARTARVITAAAAIMVAVFLAFVFSTEVFLKLMGIGMATAILVDATLVRMVLAPALMQLMGRANWWIPSWLDRVLPRLDGTAAARRAWAGAPE